MVLVTPTLVTPLPPSPDAEIIILPVPADSVTPVPAVKLNTPVFSKNTVPLPL